MAGRLRITLVKSPISHTQRTRGTIRALGLHRIGETVDLPDAPHIRGMARAVRFLVQTEEIGADEQTTEPAGAEAAPAPRRTRKKEEAEA